MLCKLQFNWAKMLNYKKKEQKNKLGSPTIANFLMKIYEMYLDSLFKSILKFKFTGNLH